MPTAFTAAKSASAANHLTNHPTTASLKRFLLGEASVRGVKVIIAHCSLGCRACNVRIEELSYELFGSGFEGLAPGLEGTADDAAPPVSSAAEYDAAIDRALVGALATLPNTVIFNSRRPRRSPRRTASASQRARARPNRRGGG